MSIARGGASIDSHIACKLLRAADLATAFFGSRYTTGFERRPARGIGGAQIANRPDVAEPRGPKTPMFSGIDRVSSIEGMYDNASVGLHSCDQDTHDLRLRAEHAGFIHSLERHAIGLERSTVRVYAMYESGGNRFLQIGVGPDGPSTIIVKLSATATAGAVLATIEGWLASTDPSTRILEVS